MKFLLPTLTSLTALLTAIPVQAETLPKGLWFGAIEVKNVNELYYRDAPKAGEPALDTTTPKPVKYPFNLQLILLSDGTNVKLLPEVYIMQTKSTSNSINTATNAASTKKRVLVTDTTKLNEYEGIIRKGDNKLVGVRLASPSFVFDYQGSLVQKAKSNLTAAEKSQWVAGGLGTNVTLFNQGEALKGAALRELSLTRVGEAYKTTIGLSQAHALNPFKHTFHNDHKQGMTHVVRDIAMTVKKSATPSGKTTTKPEANSRSMSGTYQETVYGLHKAPVIVSGELLLTKVEDLSVVSNGEGQ